MGYLTKMNGKYGQNGFSAVGFSILGQAPRPAPLSLFLGKLIKIPKFSFQCHAFIININ